jgi:tetratricopeptide (TPR) repeat protein
MPDPAPTRSDDPTAQDDASRHKDVAQTSSSTPERDRRLDHLADLLTRRNNRGEPGLALVLGAGVSLGAGVPLASGWVPLLWRYRAGKTIDKTHVQKVLAVQGKPGYSLSSYDTDFEPYAKRAAARVPGYKGEWLAAHPRNATDEYTALMGLSLSDQQQIACEILDACDLKITWPYIRIAQLIKEGYVDTVLTTNLDTVLIEALALFGVFPAICDFHAAASVRKPDARRPQIIYLHGNRHSYNVRNTGSAVQSYDASMLRFLRNLLDNRALLVSGYSGWEDGLMTVLREHFASSHDSTRPHEIFWACYRECPLPPPLAHAHGVHYLEHAPAEVLFNDLANLIEAGPVPLVSNPLQYILEILNRIDNSTQEAKAARLDEQIASIHAAAQQSKPVDATAILERAASGDIAGARAAISRWPLGASDAAQILGVAKTLRSLAKIEPLERTALQLHLFDHAGSSGIPEGSLGSARTWVHIERGDLMLVRGKVPAAIGEYRIAQGNAERLAALDPANTQWQRDLSISFERVGNVQVAQGELSAAIVSYRKDLQIAERLAALDPANTQWQRDLSVSFERVGNVQADQREFPAALDSYRKSLQIRERLATLDPANTLWQRDLSVSFNKVGDAQVAHGELPVALDSYRNGLQIAERLAALDPANTKWQHDLSVSFEKVGNVQVAQGEFPAALDSYRRSLQIRERLAALDPTNAQWRSDLSYVRHRMTEASAKLDASSLPTLPAQPKPPKPPKS